jgi:protease-4
MTNKVRISFGRVFWPSLLASVITLILIVIFFSAVLGSLFSGKKPYAVKENTILHMKLSGNIAETSSNRFEPSLMGVQSSTGLSDILFGLEKAADDKNVKGVFIELSAANCGYATATEIRKAIERFKESGKFVVAYLQGEAVSQKQYYIASVADEVYGFPSTVMEFGGLGAELMFLKGMFDKLDLEMQVIRGSNNDFKSAVEPYFLTGMSDSSRVQVERYLNDMWSQIKSTIGQQRNISIAKLDEIADSTKIRRTKDAIALSMVDGVMYRDELMTMLAEKTGVENTDDLVLETFERYAKNKFENQQKINRGKDANVAVIVAEGGVVKSGDGLSSNKITKLFQEARKDEHIKTVVFRINSPGGSALASDEIWREVWLTNQEKPVIVSMGDVAASGGYYIAAPATKIFAEPTTITGSIGVFGVIPYTGKMLENKLGLSFDEAKTNHRSVLTTNKRLSEEDYKIVQSEVDLIYDRFLEVVAEGRGMTKQAVNAVARGRVWTGNDAKAKGLVDELGGLSEAIAYAVENAGIADPIVEYMPKVKKEPWMELLEALDQDNDESQTDAIPAALLDYYKRVKNIEQYTGIQMRLPFEMIVR